MKCISLTIFAALSLTGGLASAQQQLGDHGTFAIGVDRIFGYTSYTESYDNTSTTGARTSYEHTTSNFALLGRAQSLTVAQVPRLSFDVFLGPGISLGGSIMYDHYSSSSKTAGIESPNKPSVGLWLFSPRVGFAHMFTPQIGIWPRAGVMYTHLSSDSSYTDINGAQLTANTSAGALFYTMDVNLVITPVPHVGFTVGPTLDYLLSMSQSSTPPDTTPQTNQKEHALGIQAGFLGWF